jgi:glycogen operon protein
MHHHCAVHADHARGQTPGVIVEVHAPEARSIEAVIDGGPRLALVPGDRGVWTGSVPEGSRYVLLVDGDRTALDPRATQVWFPPGHSRAAAEHDALVAIGDFPHAVAAPWPSPRPQRRTTRPLVVVEAHVRGLTMCRDRPDAGTFDAAIDELPRLAALGVSVLELLPVHQYDPDEGNYWGYMPVVFGAIHQGYAATDDAAGELADLIAAAHDHDIEVWLDVVVNHTSEADPTGPTYTLRALAERDYYVAHDDGTYVDEAGTGNMIDATSPPAQALIMEALDRLADLGVDGFRFDLAAVLAREPDFVRSIGDWGERRGVRLVAEPWDLARYLLGRDFPDDRWMQWNGRFRDDMRSFLRGEAGFVAAVAARVAGSPDLFDEPARSVNFLTAHDGYTLYDLVAYEARHNHANGWDNTDGHHDNRSWNCGWEGDDGAPPEVFELRARQMRNAWCLLLLSRGVPMFVAGDEGARTQRGNNNAYNQDNETSWIDWNRVAAHDDLERFVRRLIEIRSNHPGLWTSDDPLRCFGVVGALDTSREARSIAWSVEGLYVLANMWWEPVEFAIQEPGEWWVVLDTATGDGAGLATPRLTVAPRSIVVLER